MRARLHTLWKSRAPRERAIIAVLAVILGAALYLWLLQSAERARLPLRTSVTALRLQAARLDQQALEFGHLRAAPSATASPTNLRTLVEARVAEAGLSQALVRVDAPDADHVVVVLGAVPFADWLNWIAGLKAQQVRVDTCRIEALSAPGMVSVTATLVRAQPQ